MKRSLCIVIVALLGLMMVGVVFAATSGKMDLKVGEEVYVCNCGPSCPCNSMSMKEGNCTCGNKMVKAKVTKVEKDMAYVKAEGWEKPRAFTYPGQIHVRLRPILHL